MFCYPRKNSRAKRLDIHKNSNLSAHFQENMNAILFRNCPKIKHIEF